MASGEPEIAGNVAAYYGRLSGMVIAALRGTRSLDTDPTEAETTLAYLLLQVWFASLVGWSAGIADPKDIVIQVARAGELIGKGLGD